MSSPLLPLVVLGGSDHRPAVLPENAHEHPLTGCKGADLLLDGRPLIVELVERLRATGRFGDVFIAGPASAYRGLVENAVLVDTDGGFATNIKAAMEAVRAQHPEGEVAWSTCDILPTAEDLQVALDDYDSVAEPELWFPVVEAPVDPEALGASAWKPRYRLLVDDRQVPVLPGHLVIAEPEALRLEFMYRLLNSAYATRNLPILRRRAIMLRRLVFGILGHELLHLLQFRLPTLIWDIIFTGWRGARRLLDHRMSQAELELALRKLLVKRRQRRRRPDGRVRIPVVPTLSLARDIDTVEEAESIGATAQGV